MVTERLVRATENSAGGRSYEDLLIGPSKARTSFGWQLVLNMDTSTDNDASSPHLTTDDALAETRTNDIDIMVKQDQTIKSSSIMTGTIRAETDGQAIVVSKKSFEKIFCHICYNHEPRENIFLKT